MSKTHNAKYKPVSEVEKLIGYVSSKRGVKDLEEKDFQEIHKRLKKEHVSEEGKPRKGSHAYAQIVRTVVDYLDEKNKFATLTEKVASAFLERK
jgi:hypothetical protein